MPLARTSATRSGVGPKVARRSRCQTGSAPSRFGSVSPGAATTDALRIGSDEPGGRAGAAATPSGLVAVTFPEPGAPVDPAAAAVPPVGTLVAGRVEVAFGAVGTGVVLAGREALPATGVAVGLSGVQDASPTVAMPAPARASRFRRCT